MKRMLILILLLGILSFTNSFAEDTSSTQTQETVLKKSADTSKWKRMPSKDCILLLVNKCSIEISDFGYHQSLTIQMEGSDGFTETLTVTTFAPFCYVQLEAGNYSITATAEDGSVYKGEVCL